MQKNKRCFDSFSKHLLLSKIRVKLWFRYGKINMIVRYKNMENLRKEIDLLDEEMLELFLKRMAIVKKIALEKKDLGLPILNQNREQEILGRMTSKIDDQYLSGLYPKFIVNIMEISRIYQELLLKE